MPEENHLNIKNIVRGVLINAVVIGIIQGLAYLLGGNLSIIGWGCVGVNWLVFIHASGFITGDRTEKFYDLTGSLTYFSMIIYALSAAYNNNNNELSTRQMILSAMICIWCVRLGTFLFSRIHAAGKDTRFDVIKPNIIRFFNMWTIQGLWVFAVSLPVYLILLNDPVKELQVTDYVGMSLWFIGFLFEVMADSQKTSWREAKDNKKNEGTPFINVGLWAISRHPNYFGEITLWTGIFISATTSFTSSLQYLSFISPLLTFVLLIFVSGIPLLEKASDIKFKDNKEYQQYKISTPVLIPFVGRAGDAKF